MDSRQETLRRLRSRLPGILPSMLLCDFGNLEREVGLLTDAEADGLHLDIMDGVFVPNFTYGMTVVQAFRSLSGMVLDCHLMMVRPERYLRQFRDAGADVLTVHAEAVSDAVAVAGWIRDSGAVAGVALNPGTPVEAIEGSLQAFDLVVVMGVEAGFGGQTFRPAALDRLRGLRRLAPDILLEIDGGVSADNVSACAAAGAQLLVAGSAIFRAGDYGTAIRRLREEASGVAAGSGTAQ